VPALAEALAARTRPAATELARRLENGRIRCLACGHRCAIREGASGICKVRAHAGGELRVPTGYVAALQRDPVEKKPFFHVLPGSTALSFGMLGCDFHCAYCQNWLTSQALRDARADSPLYDVAAEELADLACAGGSKVLVSTYNEPLITIEWAVEVFAAARARGLLCGFVSNGNATREALAYLRPVAELYKIDLKGFDDRRYRSLGGVLRNVLDTLVLAKSMGFWVEVVTLVVPGFNDSERELRAAARFLAGVSPDLPWHVTAFHPDYKMQDRAWTPAETLLRARAIGLEAGLRYVYAGNLPALVGDAESTRCPRCRAMLVRRVGFRVLEIRLRDGACPDCGASIPGIWTR
jgi:pyruvate formate lyase activating enzyme